MQLPICQEPYFRKRQQWLCNNVKRIPYAIRISEKACRKKRQKKTRLLYGGIKRYAIINWLKKKFAQSLDMNFFEAKHLF